MSGNTQGANPFATNNSGGGVGIQTADPAASTNTWQMATPSNYQQWQAPDWLQSGLSASTRPITNFPVTNYGRWNYQNGATNGYGMGASPWPAPSTLFGGSGAAGNGMPPPAAGGGSKAGAGTPPPPTQPPAGGGVPPPTGGGNPPPAGGGNPPPAGGGTVPPPGGMGDGLGGGGLAYAHSLAQTRPPVGAAPTTNGYGLSPHMQPDAQFGGLGQQYAQQRALIGTGGKYGTALPAAPQGQGPMTWNPVTRQWEAGAPFQAPFGRGGGHLG